MRVINQILLIIAIALFVCCSGMPSTYRFNSTEVVYRDSSFPYLKPKWFYTVNSIGEITDFKFVPGTVNKQLLIAGTDGITTIDFETRKIIHHANYNLIFPGNGSYRIIDVDNDNTQEILLVGQHWSEYTALFGRDGKMIWKYPDTDYSAPDYKRTAFNFTLPVDIDMDGKLEFLTGYNASDEVVLIDSDGKKLRRYEWEDYNQVPVAYDINNDGLPEFIHMTNTNLTIRNVKGEILKQIIPHPHCYVNSLDVVHYPRIDGETCLSVGYYIESEKKQYMSLMSFAGNVLLSDIAEDLFRNYLDGETINLSGGDETHNMYYVRADNYLYQGNAFVGYSSSELSLQISDENNNSVYDCLFYTRKALSRGDGAMLVLDAANENEPDSILIGYGQTLWLLEENNN